MHRRSCTEHLLALFAYLLIALWPTAALAAAGQNTLELIEGLSVRDDFSQMKLDPQFTKIDLDDSVSMPWFEEKGRHKLVFVTDPFCSWCRKAYAYIVAHRKSFSSVRIALMPLKSHPGSEVPAWIFWHAVNGNMDMETLVDFTFGRLEQPDSAIPLGNIREKLASAYMRAFNRMYEGSTEDFLEYLESTHAGKVQDIHRYLFRRRIDATPVFVIDGQMVKGFNSEVLDGFLK